MTLQELAKLLVEDHSPEFARAGDNFVEVYLDYLVNYIAEQRTKPRMTLKVNDRLNDWQRSLIVTLNTDGEVRNIVHELVKEHSAKDDSQVVPFDRRTTYRITILGHEGAEGMRFESVATGSNSS